MESWNADAVIVAAGSSMRMGGADKLMEPVSGKPLLQWSVEAIERASSVVGVVVVTREDRVDELKRTPWLDGKRVVAGGAERSDSVRAGLAVTNGDVVLVHDGARPLVSSILADAVAHAAAEHGAAIPVLPVTDSLKRAGGGSVMASVDRTGLVRTQTPQGARRGLLVMAFEQAGQVAYTDEAALLEAAGVPVVTVPGDAANIKVTDQSELEMVRALARGRTGERIGFGEDVHVFGPGDGLVLGGVEIPEAPRLYGHSDGDVALHALATSILSACGLGDLGQMYPSDDPQTAGIASTKLLTEAVARVVDAGWMVGHARVSIVGARPTLGARRLDAMRRTISNLISTSEESVAVTASSGNLASPEGAGRQIRATALVTVIRR